MVKCIHQIGENRETSSTPACQIIVALTKIGVLTYIVMSYPSDADKKKLNKWNNGIIYIYHSNGQNERKVKPNSNFDFIYILKLCPCTSPLF